MKKDFLCVRPLEEVAILCDGRITTCCIDEKGENSFAGIYDDESTFLEKYHNLGGVLSAKANLIITF